MQSAPELDYEFDSFVLYVCYPPAASAHPTALKLPTRGVLVAIERVARKLVGKWARSGVRVRLLRVTLNGRRFRSGASMIVRSGRKVLGWGRLAGGRKFGARQPPPDRLTSRLLTA